MLATIVYLLCALTSVMCAWVLYNSYDRSKSALLLWCSLCFVTLAVGNILLVIDLVVTGPTVDLSFTRGIVAFVGFSFLIFGLVWETV